MRKKQSGETKKNLFTASSCVSSERILYTPSPFARASLLHLQEIGSLKALSAHTSTRNSLVSYLFFIVEEGSGMLAYEGKQYKLKKGDCVFIDCRKHYAHSTDTDFWTLRWCHFYGLSAAEIYEKYKERGGQPTICPRETEPFLTILTQLYAIAKSSDYIRDMRINEKRASLLTLLMEQSWHPENSQNSKKRRKLTEIKKYLDEHYTEKINLDTLAGQFYINKYYLVKLFKEAYGTTINSYILSLWVTKAKQMLRFSDMTMDEIGAAVGMKDGNYFARMFKKIEGISPGMYRRMW